MKDFTRMLIVPILLAVMAAGCGHDETVRRLNEADRLIDTLPDSALTVIRTIDAKELKGSEQRARHSLLETMALLKIDPSAATDSLFSPAWDYYADKKNLSRETMLTHFAKAALYTAQDSVALAIMEYDKVIFFADSLTNILYSGLSYLNTASLYCRKYDFSFDETILNKAESLLTAYAFKPYIIGVHIVKGTYAEGRQRLEDAYGEYSKAYSVSECIGDSVNMMNVKARIAINLIMRDSLASGTEKFKEALMSGYTPDEQQLFVYAVGLQNLGKYMQAEEIYSYWGNSDSDISKARKYYLMSRASEVCGDKGISQSYMDSSTIYTNRAQLAISAQFHNKDIGRKLKSANESLTQSLKKEHEGRSFWVSVSLVVLVGLCAGGYFGFKQFKKMKDKSRKSDEKIVEIQSDYENMKMSKEELSRQLYDLEKWNEGMQADKAKLKNTVSDLTLRLENVCKSVCDIEALRSESECMNEKISEIKIQIKDKLSIMADRFLDFHRGVADRFNRTPKGNRHLIENFEKDRELVFNDYKESCFNKELERDMDLLLDGMVTYMRDELNFTEDVVLTAILGICGFNYKSIGMILNIPAKTASARLSRIKDRFKENHKNDPECRIRHLPFAQN